MAASPTDKPPSDRERLGLAWNAYVTTIDERPPAATPSRLIAANNFCFAEVWPRPGLDVRSRRWISLTCTAYVGAEMPLHSHVYSALNSGDMTLEEMREFTLHFAAYAGLPKAAAVDQAIDVCWKRIQEQGGPAGPGERPPSMPQTERF